MAYNPYRFTYSANNYWEGAPGSFGLATIALDSAYIYDSAGDAFAGVFQFNGSIDITDIWIYVDSFVEGTPGTSWQANTDGQINIDVREFSATTHKPGTTIAGSGTIALAGTESGWVKKTLATPISVVAGKVYAVDVHDDDGSVADHVVLGRSSGQARGSPATARLKTTPDGWATPSETSGVAAICLKAGGVMWGSPFTLNQVRPGGGSTLMYGNKFTLPFPLRMIGVATFIDNVVASGVWRLFAGATNPDGQPLASWAVVNTAHHSAANQPWFMFNDVDGVDLEVGEEYRLVLDKSSSLTVPREYVVGAGIDADLRDLFPFDGTMRACEESGDGLSWNDSDDTIADIGMMFVPIDNSGGVEGDTIILPPTLVY